MSEPLAKAVRFAQKLLREGIMQSALAVHTAASFYRVPVAKLEQALKKLEDDKPKAKKKAKKNSLPKRARPAR